MKHAAIALMLMLLPCFTLSAAALPDTTLFVASDLHFIAPELTDHGAYFTKLIADADGKATAYCDEIVQAFVQEVLAAAPDALILSGDLTFNGAKRSHEELARRLAPIREAGIPVFVIPGNHDLNNRSAASFSGDSYTRVQPTIREDFTSIYADLGFSAALARDYSSLSYVAEVAPDLRVIMLDVNTESPTNTVSDNTLRWLETQLQSAQQAGARVISVSHQNIFAHSSLLYRGFMINNADKLRRLYERYGVSLNFSGHIHMQHTKVSEAGLLEIASSSLAVSPCQYGVVTLTGREGSYRTRPVDVAAWAKAKGLANPDLLAFPEYAAAFFSAKSLRQEDSAASDEQRAITRYMAHVNAAYFAGRTDLIEQNPSLAAACTAGDTFFSQYIASILGEPPLNHTELDFTL